MNFCPSDRPIPSVIPKRPGTPFFAAVLPRSGSKLLAPLCLLLLLFGIVPSVEAQPPATVLLLRHAEKLTDGRVDLSSEGFARAKDLPQLFLGPKSVFPRPDALFATHLSRHSNRPFETIEPLSKALNLTVDTTYVDDDYASLAKLLLSGEYAGKIVLVAWHHGTLPQFAAALGVDPQPAPWPATQFDHLWRIDWPQGSTKPTFKDLPQQLMPGDSK